MGGAATIERLPAANEKTPRALDGIRVRRAIYCEPKFIAGERRQAERAMEFAASIARHLEKVYDLTIEIVNHFKFREGFCE